MISVVVPAHNEEAVIARCLHALTRVAQEFDIEVLVVCNGCTDSTAERARSFEGPVRVVEIETASKIAALNVADDSLTTFPRVYVDADVELTPGSLSELVAPLVAQTCALAVPRSRYLVSSAGPLVRSYVRFWQRLPQVVAVSAGSGVYALSASGRNSFGQWPEVTNDDAFIRSVLSERMQIVERSVSMVQAPRTARAMIRRKVRVAHGNREIGARVAGPHPTLGWIRVLRERPGALLDLPAYICITVLSRVMARVSRRPDWGSDETTRRPLRTARGN